MEAMHMKTNRRRGKEDTTKRQKKKHTYFKTRKVIRMFDILYIIF